MSPALIRFCALLSLALSACATATPPTNVNPTSPKTTMNISTNGTSAPKVQQLSKGLLALIGSLQSNNDLTPERIEQTTGLTMQADTGTPGDYELRGRQLNDEWRYSLFLLNHAKESAPSLIFSISLTKQYANIHPSPSMAPACIDLEQFHQSLLDLNYLHIGSMRGDSLGRQYQRGDVRIEISYVGESMENINHDCISLIHI